MDFQEAGYFLFEHDFGKRPLFKNQVDLVNELLFTPGSNYYITLSHSDEKEVERRKIKLKTYLSQLLNDSIRRNITPDFYSSLKFLLKKKIDPLVDDSEEVFTNIIASIKEKNRKDVSKIASSDFISDVLKSRYVSIFTAREVNLGTELSKHSNLIGIFFTNLMFSLTAEKPLVLYRFNFPSEDMCRLFWSVLKKTLIKLFKPYPNNIGAKMFSRESRFENVIQYFRNKGKLAQIVNEDQVASLILNELAEKRIICLFSHDLPIFATPIVSVNPNDNTNAVTYTVLQDEMGKDNFKKMTQLEFFHWKKFFWDRIKVNQQKTRIVMPENIEL